MFWGRVISDEDIRGMIFDEVQWRLVVWVVGGVKDVSPLESA